MEDRSVLSISSGPPDEVVAYGPLPDHVADIRHGRDASQHPLVVFLHGGFWRPEYDRAHTGPLADAVARAGWTVASVEYRRTPGRPDETIDDIELAVSTIGTLVSGHRGDLVIAGHSAGGHLALWLAAVADPATTSGIVALAPVADLGLAEWLGLGDGAVGAFLGTAAAERPDLDPTRRPVPRVPTTIVHGALDSIVPVGVAGSHVAAQPTTRLVVVDCAHFEVIDPRSAAWPTVVAELTRFG